jgi:hypothetical protein
MKFIVSTRNEILFNKFFTKISVLEEGVLKNEIIANKYLHHKSSEADYLNLRKNKSVY